MTLRLILTRHAKSNWDNPAQPDHERTLNPRGERAALALGEWLRTRGHVPDTILVSTATRTLQTCERIVAALQADPAIERIKTLYHADADHMLDRIKEAEGETVLLIGHNPGCARLALALAAEPPLHDRFGTYPTAATTVFDFDAQDWADIAPGKGVVRDFVVPRDLGVN